MHRQWYRFTYVFLPLNSTCFLVFRYHCRCINCLDNVFLLSNSSDAKMQKNLQRGRNQLEKGSPQATRQELRLVKLLLEVFEFESNLLFSYIMTVMYVQ